MPTLRLYLLGPPRIELDAELIEIQRRKVLALLTYLAVTGETQRRDTLATLLWPEASQRRARAGLRNALWALNKSPLVDWLTVGAETVALNSEVDLEVDVVHFRELVAACQHHGHTPNEGLPRLSAVQMKPSSSGMCRQGNVSKLSGQTGLTNA